MATLIPPRRDENMLDQGVPTKRLIRFFEELSRISNEMALDIETTVDISGTVGQIASLRDEVEALKNAVEATRYRAMTNEIEALKDEIWLLRHHFNTCCENIMRYRGTWNTDVIYDIGDVAYQNGWLGSALRLTTDELAPANAGTAAYLLPTTPAWTTGNQVAVVGTGALYEFTNSLQVERVRVWPTDVGVNFTNVLYIIDETDPDRPVVSQQVLTGLVADQWNTVAAGISLIPAGSKLRGVLQTTNSGSTSLVTGGWTNEGTQNTAGPGAQGWNRRNQNNVLRINKTDLDSVNRSTELLGVTVDSTIECIQTNDTGRNRTYRVINPPVDQVDYVEYSVFLEANSPQDIGVGETTTINIEIPIPSGVDYVELPGFFPANSPTWATVTGYLSFDGVDQAQTTSAFGFDIEGTLLDPSPDWAILALTGEFYRG